MENEFIVNSYPVIETTYKFLNDWIMTPLEDINHFRNFENHISPTSKDRLSSFFKAELDNKFLEFDLENLELLESILKNKSFDNQNRLSIISLAIDLYCFFGESMIAFSKKNNGSVSWVGMITKISSDRMSDQFKPSISGFYGKYLGRLPNVYCIDELVEQLTNGTYTNLLSEKFKELAPYTHKKAPKK
jgi:hypothetical protein